MSDKKIVVWILLFVIAVVGLSIMGAGIRQVPSGYVGIRLSWGKIIGTTGEGFNWVNVVFGGDVQLVNVQIQTYNSGAQSTGTIDLQEVTTNVTVNYRVDPAYAEEIFRDLRDQYESRIVRPQLEGALKSTTAQFTSTEMILSRASVRSQLFKSLKERLEPFHIIVVETALTDFQFDPKFSAQLEATAAAQKKVLEEEANLKVVELQQQQKVITAKAEANATIARATAEAQANVLIAEARAKAIDLIQSQLAQNPEYLEYLSILQWNGVLPYFYGSDAPLPFIMLDEDG